MAREQVGEPLPALAGTHESFPVGNRHVDRRQRARRQDRAGDDDARGRLLIDDQIAADGEHRRLQHHAEHLGHGAEAAGDVAHAPLAFEIFLVGLVPAPRHPPQHAHGDERLGIAPAGVGERIAGEREPGRFLDRPAGHVFGDQRHAGQDDGAAQRGDADQRVKGEADRDVERHPGQIEHGDRPEAAEEAADAVEIAHRQHAVVALADLERQARHRVEHAGAQRLVEARADTHQDAPADQVEHALGGVEEGRQDDEADQGRHAAARHHAVVDLQHEEGAGEVEHVDHRAHHADGDEGAAAGMKRARKLGRLVPVRFGAVRMAAEHGDG